MTGRRMFQLLDSRYNEGVVDTNYKTKEFDTFDVISDIECRVNRVKFIVPGNSSGIKRPQIQIDGDVERAHGPFTKKITTIDFTHDHQELPISYITTIDDDTMLVLIEAGFYDDPRFEELLSKLMSDEMFRADSDLVTTVIDLGDGEDNELPVLLVEPINAIHVHHDPSHRSTVQSLMKRSANLAIELKKDGVDVDKLIYSDKDYIDREVVLLDDFEDVVDKEKVQQMIDLSKISTTSELLDEEIDITDMLKDNLTFDNDDVDSRIRDLKDDSVVVDELPEHEDVEINARDIEEYKLKQELEIKRQEKIKEINKKRLVERELQLEREAKQKVDAELAKEDVVRESVDAFFDDFDDDLEF